MLFLTIFQSSRNRTDLRLPSFELEHLTKESEWKCDFLHVFSINFLSADKHQINTQFLLELMLRD